MAGYEDKMIRVRDVMSRQVFTVSPTDTAQSVADRKSVV